MLACATRVASSFRDTSLRSPDRHFRKSAHIDELSRCPEIVDDDRSLARRSAYGTDATIKAAVDTTGFTPADQKEGWSLVLRAYAAPSSPSFTPDAGPVGDAVKEIDAWQQLMFPRAHAALRRLHPEQDAFVFDNITPGTGIGSVPSVTMFLDRLDALESSPDRKSTRKADHAALATLTQRGITTESRKHLHQLVKLIETSSAPTLAAQQPDARAVALAAVYDWIQDWSECARGVITNRSHLIKMGIGKRRSRKSDAQPDPTPAPIVATPVAPSDAASTNPALVQSARAMLALPPKSNGATPGSNGASVNGGDHG